MRQGVDQAKEGFGDGEVDDPTSYMDPHNYLGAIPGNGKAVLRSLNEHLVCKACRSREVSVLLIYALSAPVCM